MKTLEMALRAMGAAAALGCLALAGPAAAGGGIRIDSPDNSTGHNLGSWGGPESFGLAVLGFNDDGSSFVDHVKRFSLVGAHGVIPNLYISQDGYAGLGPLGGDASSLSTLLGDFFAPALGIVDDGSPVFGTISYMTDATVVTWTKNESTPDERVFQLEFDVISPTLVGVGFNYDCFPDEDNCSGPPANGFRLGNTFKDFGGEQTAGYVAFLGVTSSTPEPAAWTIMLLGFGAAGSVLRRRRAIAIG